MQLLILARHGESEYSARGLLNGDPTVGVALTETGEAQARTLGVVRTWMKAAQRRAR